MKRPPIFHGIEDYIQSPENLDVLAFQVHFRPENLMLIENDELMDRTIIVEQHIGEIQVRIYQKDNDVPVSVKLPKDGSILVQREHFDMETQRIAELMQSKEGAS